MRSMSTSYRATHPDVYLVEKVLRRKEDKVYVKWLEFAQFMDTKTMSFDWWKFWFMYFSTYKKYITV